MNLSLADWQDTTLRDGLALIMCAEPPESQGLIYIPELDRPPTSWGWVANMGKSLNGDPGFKVGDWVVFARWSGPGFRTTDKRDLTIVRHEDVDAVVETD